MGTVPIVIFRGLPLSRPQQSRDKSLFLPLDTNEIGVKQGKRGARDRKVFLDCTRQVYNLGNGGVPFHHDPVDGIQYGQATKNDNGDGPHSRFPGFVHIPSTGSW